jgi:hypothetical protein
MSRGLQAGEDDTRTLTDLLVSQVREELNAGRNCVWVGVREGSVWIWCIGRTFEYPLNRQCQTVNNETHGELKMEVEEVQMKCVKGFAEG